MITVGVIGKKIGMTRIMSDYGTATGVTVIQIEKNRLVQRKNKNIDGYDAVQLVTGYKLNKKGDVKIRRTSKALLGHYAKANEKIGFGLCEFPCSSDLSDKQSFDLSLFNEGQYINVSGISKGKGFAGGVKRHNFKMQDATHGNSISHRVLGSTGQCQDPGRVFKGKKMAGHMGNERITQQNLKIVKIDYDKQVLLVKGSIPGSNNSYVRVVLSPKKLKANEQIFQAVEKAKITVDSEDETHKEEEKVEVKQSQSGKEVKVTKDSKSKDSTYSKEEKE